MKWKFTKYSRPMTALVWYLCHLRSQKAERGKKIGTIFFSNFSTLTFICHTWQDLPDSARNTLSRKNSIVISLVTLVMKRLWTFCLAPVPTTLLAIFYQQHQDEIPSLVLFDRLLRYKIDVTVCAQFSEIDPPSTWSLKISEIDLIENVCTLFRQVAHSSSLLPEYLKNCVVHPFYRSI